MEERGKKLIAIVALSVLIYVGSIGTDFVSGAAKEKPYPSREVNICVGFAPGGNADTVARATGKVLSKMWGQQVVIINKPGGSQSISFSYVANAKPDGHTLSYILNPYLVMHLS